MRYRSLIAVAIATVTLAACGGGGSNAGGSASSSSEAVDSLTVLDYYTDEPSHTLIGDQLSACGTSIGVAKVDHQSVPGPTLIQKVLQQASSKSLPDVLMLDNPDIQQIAEAGALVPLGDFGLNADGYAPGPVSAATSQKCQKRPFVRVALAIPRSADKAAPGTPIADDPAGFVISAAAQIPEFGFKPRRSHGPNRSLLRSNQPSPPI